MLTGTDAGRQTPAVLGIDPGLSGGLAVVAGRGTVLELAPMPLVGPLLDLPALAVLIRRLRTIWQVEIAFLEQAAARPGQGVSSMFKFGRVYGACEGILASQGVPYQLVTPQAWQKVMHQGVERRLAPKARSLVAAGRLFPGADFKASSRTRNPHLGMLEAALIAEYGRRERISEA